MSRSATDIRLTELKDTILKLNELIDKQSAPKGSRLAKVLIYVRNQKQYMMTYLEDGHCSISNNLNENSIRPVTVGRRNWLFCDTMAGANASMAVYSLIETDKANSLNPKNI